MCLKQSRTEFSNKNKFEKISKFTCQNYRAKRDRRRKPLIRRVKRTQLNLVGQSSLKTSTLSIFIKNHPKKQSNSTDEFWWKWELHNQEAAILLGTLDFFLTFGVFENIPKPLPSINLFMESDFLKWLHAIKRMIPCTKHDQPKTRLFRLVRR